MSSVTFSWRLASSAIVSGTVTIDQDSRLLVYSGQVVCRETVVATIPPLRTGDTLTVGSAVLSVQEHGQIVQYLGSRPTLGVALGSNEVPDPNPDPDPDPPPLTPPDQTWAYGPVSSNITVSYFGSEVRASSTAPGVAFYRWALAIANVVSAKAYWEFVVAGASTTTYGGFGVGPCSVDTGGRPGVGTNPGCMLYWEGGEAAVWCDGTEHAVDAPAEPTRIGVGIEVMTSEVCHVVFYSSGVALNAEPFAMILEGSIVVPVVCALNANAVFTLDDRV